MGLKEIQEQFVHLALDSSFRERLFSQNPTEENLFNSLEAEIAITARSLISKRMGIVANQLPLTRKLLGDEFGRKFREYAQIGKEPQGVNRHRLDSIRFARHLVREIRAGKLPRPLGTLLVHETSPLHMWMKRKRFVIRFCRYDPGALQQLVRTTGSVDGVSGCLTFVIWRECRSGQGYRWSTFPVG